MTSFAPHRDRRDHARTSVLSPRRARTDAIEPLLDGREACLDGRLELGVGKDIGPVVFDALAHKFADVERIDPASDTGVDHVQDLYSRTLRRHGFDLASETLRQVAPGVHDVRANKAWT